MGQGQADVAMATLKECAANGDWLCLKNLHLMTHWLETLEAALLDLSVNPPHQEFRLWLTTEPHPDFPQMLLENSLKLT